MEAHLRSVVSFVDASILAGTEGDALSALQTTQCAQFRMALGRMGCDVATGAALLNAINAAHATFSPSQRADLIAAVQSSVGAEVACARSGKTQKHWYSYNYARAKAWATLRNQDVSEEARMLAWIDELHHQGCRFPCEKTKVVSIAAILAASGQSVTHAKAYEMKGKLTPTGGVAQEIDAAVTQSLRGHPIAERK